MRASSRRGGGVQGVERDIRRQFRLPGRRVDQYEPEVGTNSLHGQVYGFVQSPLLTADKFFRLSAGRAQFRLYRWGANVSGPIELPKLYSGRNRTFFMYGYEGIWSFDPSP
jgi:hypothetical protein